MRGRFRLPMLVIAGALLGLIALLATLQYRWLGQISGAERDRMKTTLNSRANGFGEDVDREVTRAYLLFQLDAMQEEPAVVARIAARYDRWQATSRFPRMIKDVYVVTSTDTAAPVLQRFNAATRFLEPVEWPDALAPVHKMVARATAPPPAPSASGAPPLLMRSTVPTVWASIPALVISSPMLMVSHFEVRGQVRTPQAVQLSSGLRYTITLLDGDYIKGEMLPALAKQHFQGNSDGFDYQLAVVPTAATPSVPLYRSAASFAPAADDKADATVDVFQVRPKDFEPLVAEVSRFMTFTAVPRGADAQHTLTEVRQTITSAQNVAISPAPMSFVVQSDKTSTTTQQRIGAMLSGAAGTFSARVSSPSAAPWRLLVK